MRSTGKIIAVCSVAILLLISLILFFIFNQNIDKVADVDKISTLEETVNKKENNEEWYLTYSKIIEDTLLQQNKKQIYFREMYIADGYELPLDGAGGVSVGYPLTSDDFLFYLQDVTTDLDSIPELFLGIKENEEIKILALYTFNSETHIAKTISTLSVEYNPEIYLCKNNLILEGNTSGGEFIIISKNGRMPFSAFRQGQDEGTIIKPEEMGWKNISEW